jgi:anti-anti-sigma regulatory factor
VGTVLRITRQTHVAATVTLKLEGRLMEPWASELDRLATDALDRRNRLVLDLSGLLFVDREGIALLRALGARGASLSGGSSFVTALVEGDHT